MDALLGALASHGKPLARADLDSIVATSDKRRFALSPDGSMIRGQMNLKLRWAAEEHSLDQQRAPNCMATVGFGDFTVYLRAGAAEPGCPASHLAACSVPNSDAEGFAEL